MGASALANNTTGDSNTGTGIAALFLNTTGHINTANGSNALANNTHRFFQHRPVETTPFLEQLWQ